MTELLEEAMRKAASLPKEEQDRIGAKLLAEMEADEQWEATLTSPESLALLDEWAAEALRDLEEGRRL